LSSVPGVGRGCLRNAPSLHAHQILAHVQLADTARNRLFEAKRVPEELAGIDGQILRLPRDCEVSAYVLQHATRAAARRARTGELPTASCDVADGVQKLLTERRLAIEEALSQHVGGFDYVV